MAYHHKVLSFLKTIFKKKKPFVDENGNEEANRLPKEMPTDFSVELRFGGGIRIGGTIITLKLGESTYHTYSGIDQHTRCTFILSETEILEVFRSFQLYKFDKVEMQEDLRMDYPSTRITASWDKKFITLHTGQVFQVKEDSLGDFHYCVALVRSIGDEKAKQTSVVVQIVLDEPLQNPASGFAIYFDKEFTEGPYPWYDASSGKPPELLNLLPGVYLFKCYCYEVGKGVITKSSPSRYSSYLTVTIPELKSVVVKISTNGYSFFYELS